MVSSPPNSIMKKPQRQGTRGVGGKIRNHRHSPAIPATLPQMPSALSPVGGILWNSVSKEAMFPQLVDNSLSSVCFC